MNYFFKIIITCCIFSSCKKDPSLFVINNLNNNQIGCFGHAGMGIGFKYPINSFESLNTCFEISADGSEMDVQMTKDSVLVLYHDSRLETSTAMNGMINEKTWLELKDLVYANPFSSSLKIQSLEQILRKFHNQKRLFTLDCKLYNRSELAEQEFNEIYARAIIKLVNRLKMEDYVFIESHQVDFLKIMSKAGPHLKLFINPSSFEEGLDIASQIELFGITISNRAISKSQIIDAHNKGLRITLWDVNTNENNIDAIDKSPDYIQSDKIIHLLHVFD